MKFLIPLVLSAMAVVGGWWAIGESFSFTNDAWVEKIQIPDRPERERWLSAESVARDEAKGTRYGALGWTLLIGAPILGFVSGAFFKEEWPSIKQKVRKVLPSIPEKVPDNVGWDR